MPEGDTIYRTARTLRRALLGSQVTVWETTVPQLRGQEHRLVGQTVTEVEPRGKHLLIWFAPARLALHSHMRMTGSWHLYRPGQRWRKPARLARVVLEVPEWTAVCFAAPICEVLSRAQVDRHPSLTALGPDALASTTDLAEARRRLDLRAGWAIGEALLDQRVLAGVGNVYKNEVLFIHRVDPWRRVGEVPPAVRDALLATAERLLKTNVRPGTTARITTTGGGGSGNRVAVYGKARRPCPRCGTPIRLAAQGSQGRQTYWCPRCQAPGPSRTGVARGGP
ncbi:MAG: Fpg/Nei family DNA glycosylase [Euzebyales bacterium]|nr:Fpg/Nei family DNA glycosylase [Euzebyales bacterium]